MAILVDESVVIVDGEDDLAPFVHADAPRSKRHRTATAGLSQCESQNDRCIESDAQLAAALARIEAEDVDNDVLLVRSSGMADGKSSSSSSKSLTNDCKLLSSSGPSASQQVDVDTLLAVSLSAEDHECGTINLLDVPPSLGSSSSGATAQVRQPSARISTAADAQLAAALAALDAEDEGVVSNKFNCSCCMEDVESMKGVYMSPSDFSTCRHMMCCECFERFVKGQIEKKELCRCPFCPGPKACVVPGWLIRRMLGGETADSIAKIEQIHLNQVDSGSESLWQCPMPDCTNRFFVPSGFNPSTVPDAERVVGCDKCHKNICVRCNVEEHAGFSCTQFEDWRKANAAADESYANMVKASLIKPCPNCAAPILKSEGCNFVTCTSCKSPNGMCWQTGKARYGPNSCGGGHGCH